MIQMLWLHFLLSMFLKQSVHCCTMAPLCVHVTAIRLLFCALLPSSGQLVQTASRYLTELTRLCVNPETVNVVSIVTL